MTLRLHGSPDSANLPVRIALNLFELPFEAVRVDRAARENRQAAYLAKNPQGLIPVLEDGALVLFETGAILWHLAEKVGRFGPEGASFDDAEARATALKWMFYLSNTVHADLRIGFNAQRYIADEAGADALERGVAKRIGEYFDLIEREYPACSSSRPVEVTDLYLAAMVRWAQLYPRERPMIEGLDAWPALHVMCQRIEGAAGARAAFEAESISAEQAITAPQYPDLPLSEVTGV